MGLLGTNLNGEIGREVNELVRPWLWCVLTFVFCTLIVLLSPYFGEVGWSLYLGGLVCEELLKDTVLVLTIFIFSGES